jgi:hypothetical protein
MESILIGFGALLIYFFPSFVAVGRKSRKDNQVFIINLFLGWTVIGWIIALMMAVSTSKYKEKNLIQESKMSEELKEIFSREVPENKTAKKANKVESKKLFKQIGAIILIILCLRFWYVGIPVLSAWYLWFKTQYPQKKRLIIAAIVAVIFLSAGIVNAYIGRKPTVTIYEPKDGYSVEAKSILIKGSVKPVRAEISVADKKADIDSSGNFTIEASLLDENNDIIVTAKNRRKIVTKSMRVKRIFTAAEQKERARIAAELEAQEKATQAKAMAEQAAYEKSKEGRICKKHPGWSKEECAGVANRKFWIGMSYDMLVEAIGKPDHSNPSDYGSGTKWQWCWDDIRPSCFYDNNDDGIIDAYN